MPNVGLREHEIEQFEDDPLEYIRRDISIASAAGDASTRRQAAADVVRALVTAGLQTEVTEITSQWISQGLQQYAQGREKGIEDAWKAKDTAVYLFTAVATRGSTSQVCSTCSSTLSGLRRLTPVFASLESQAPTRL